MRGQVLQGGAITGGGIILGADGNRYSFSSSDWKGTAPPQTGEQVDFVASDAAALDIFPLPGGAATSPGVAQQAYSAASSTSTAGPMPTRGNSGQAVSNEGSSVALGIVGIAGLVLGFMIPVLPTIAALIVGLIGADSAKRHNNDSGLILSRIAWIGALVLLVLGAVLLILAMMFAWPLVDFVWQLMVHIYNEEQAKQALMAL